MDHPPEMKAALALASMPPAVYMAIYGERKPNTLAVAIAEALPRQALNHGKAD